MSSAVHTVILCVVWRCRDPVLSHAKRNDVDVALSLPIVTQSNLFDRCRARWSVFL